jgi:hypothetical protein
MASNTLEASDSAKNNDKRQILRQVVLDLAAESCNDKNTKVATLALQITQSINTWAKAIKGGEGESKVDSIIKATVKGVSTTTPTKKKKVPEEEQVAQATLSTALITIQNMNGDFHTWTEPEMNAVLARILINVPSLGAIDRHERINLIPVASRKIYTVMSKHFSQSDMDGLISEEYHRNMAGANAYAALVYHTNNTSLIHQNQSVDKLMNMAPRNGELLQSFVNRVHNAGTRVIMSGAGTATSIYFMQQRAIMKHTPSTLGDGSLNVMYAPVITAISQKQDFATLKLELDKLAQQYHIAEAWKIYTSLMESSTESACAARISSDAGNKRGNTNPRRAKCAVCGGIKTCPGGKDTKPQNCSRIEKVKQQTCFYDIHCKKKNCARIHPMRDAQRARDGALANNAHTDLQERNTGTESAALAQQVQGLTETVQGLAEMVAALRVNGTGSIMTMQVLGAATALDDETAAGTTRHDGTADRHGTADATMQSQLQAMRRTRAHMDAQFRYDTDNDNASADNREVVDAGTLGVNTMQLGSAYSISK